MRKLILLAGLLAVMLPVSMLADTIDLNTPASGTFSFTGNGSSGFSSISFTSATWTAMGQGSVLGSTSGYADLTQGSATITGTNTLDQDTAGGLEAFNLSQTGTMTLCYSSSAGCTGTVYLSGDATFTGLAGPDGGSPFEFSGSLTDLSGLYASNFGSGSLGFLVDINANTDLSDLTNGATASAVVSTGEVITPEPGTAKLLNSGLGLLALAAFLL